MSVDLSRIDWGYGVPTERGTFNANNLENLTNIVANEKVIQNPVIQKKCWNFATHQSNGKNTYKAGKILADRNIAVARDYIKFESQHFETPVDSYKLTALKKDYPEFDKASLKKIASYQFDQLLNFLYEDKELTPYEIQDIFRILNTLGIEDRVLEIKYKDKIPKEFTFYYNLPANQIPRVFEALMEYVKKNSDKNYKSDEAKSAKEAFYALEYRIDNLEKTKRKDVIASVELSKILRREGNFSFQAEGYYSHLMPNNKVNVNVSGILADNKKNILESQDLNKDSNIFSKIAQKILSFLSEALLNWFDTDRTFILNVLKGAPDLELEVPYDIPLEMIQELAKMENLRCVYISPRVSVDCEILLQENNINYERRQVVKVF